MLCHYHILCESPSATAELRRCCFYGIVVEDNSISVKIRSSKLVAGTHAIDDCYHFEYGAVCEQALH